MTWRRPCHGILVEGLLPIAPHVHLPQSLILRFAAKRNPPSQKFSINFIQKLLLSVDCCYFP